MTQLNLEAGGEAGAGGTADPNALPKTTPQTGEVTPVAGEPLPPAAAPIVNEPPAPKPAEAAAEIEPGKQPKQRGNTPLAVKGKERTRIPDEHDVIVDNVIVGRDADPKKREAILKQHKK